MWILYMRLIFICEESILYQGYEIIFNIRVPQGLWGIHPLPVFLFPIQF